MTLGLNVVHCGAKLSNNEKLRGSKVGSRHSEPERCAVLTNTEHHPGEGTP